MMPVLIFVFSLYMGVFRKLSAANQANFAALWPLLKVGMKRTSQWLLVQGLNPDMQPFSGFAFDCAAAMCANLLFMASVDWRSVAVLIAIDLIENLYYMLRAISFFSAAKIVRTDFTTCVHSNLIRSILKDRPIADAGDAATVDALLPLLDAVQPPQSKEMLKRNVAEDVVVHENAAICSILNMAVAELGEILSSLWVLVCMPLLVAFDTNTEHFAFFAGPAGGSGGRTSWELLARPMTFSAVDAVFELLSFTVVGYLVRAHTGVHVLSGLVEYLDALRLRSAVLGAAAFVIIVAVAQFLVHFGCASACGAWPWEGCAGLGATT